MTTRSTASASLADADESTEEMMFDVNDPEFVALVAVLGDWVDANRIEKPTNLDGREAVARAFAKHVKSAYPDLAKGVECDSGIYNAAIHEWADVSDDERKTTRSTVSGSAPLAPLADADESTEEMTYDVDHPVFVALVVVLGDWVDENRIAKPTKADEGEVVARAFAKHVKSAHPDLAKHVECDPEIYSAVIHEWADTSDDESKK